MIWGYPVAFQETWNLHVSIDKWVGSAIQNGDLSSNGYLNGNMMIHYHYQWTYTLLRHGKAIRNEGTVLRSKKLEMEKEWWTGWPRARWEIDSQSHKYKKWCSPVMWCYVCCPVNPIAPEIYPVYFTLPRHVYEVTWSYMKLPHSSCGTALWWPRFAMSPEITHHFWGPQIRTTELKHF